MRPLKDRLHTIKMSVRKDCDIQWSLELRHNQDKKRMVKKTTEEIIREIVRLGFKRWENYLRVNSIDPKEAGDWDDPEYRQILTDRWRGYSSNHYSGKRSKSVEKILKPEKEILADQVIKAAEELKKLTNKARKAGVEVTITKLEEDEEDAN